MSEIEPESDPADTDELSEDEAFEIALDDHPQLKRMFLDDSLPEEMEDGHGNVWSPMAHLSLHAAIECQIANDDPSGITNLTQQLDASGIDHHEIRHLLGDALAQVLWDAVNEDHDFNVEKYMALVRKIVRDVSSP